MDNDEKPKSWNWVILIGGFGMMMAIIVDSFSVIGRHISLPLIGSIEIVQIAILIVGCAGFLIATMEENHANVHLLVERLPQNVQKLLKKINKIVIAIFFALILSGLIWQFKDYIGAFEESEILKIPYPPMRIITIISMALVLLVLLSQTIKGERK